MKNETGVSPVIGVILMVAITVILAAVITAFVIGMSGNIQKDNQTQGNTTTEPPALTLKHTIVEWDDGDLAKVRVSEDNLTCYVLRTHAVGMNQFYTMSCLPDKTGESP